MDSDPHLAAALLVAALAFVAFFAGSEAAFLALKPAAWVRWQEERRPLGRLLSSLHTHRTTVVATIMAAGLVATYLAQYLSTTLGCQWLGLPWGPVVAFLLTALVVVTVCLAPPVSYSTQEPEKAARSSAPLLALVTVLAAPVILLLTGISRLILLALGAREKNLPKPVRDDQLKTLLAESEQQDTLPEPQRQMLYGVLDFADQSVAQVMTPRPDIISVPADASLREALAVALEYKHSRLPVYGQDDDDIIGVLYLKDILPYLRDEEMNRPIRRATRPAFYVPETLPASELLRRLQRQRQTIAIVRDEFGGTAGLVTIEDLLEEIVGAIHDEYDQGEEPEIIEVSEEEWLCDGSVSLHPLENLLHQELPDEQYESLAGFVLDLAGKIPDSGESFTWGNLTLVAERVHQHRLEKVRIIKHLLEEESSDPGD